MGLHTDLQAALRDAIKTVWPEVTDGGIWAGYDFARNVFERLAQAGDLPVAVFDLELRSSEDWGAGNDVEEGPVYIYYICDTSISGDDFIAKLEAMRAHIWDNGLSEGQVNQFPSISYSMFLSMNDYFISKQRQFRAGAVILQLIAGVTNED